MSDTSQRKKPARSKGLKMYFPIHTGLCAAIRAT
jgi:hypothetical protein